MSKAAVAHMTRQMAAELTGEMIDVFAICPGATNTKMFQSSTLDPMTPDQRAAFTDALPKHRLIEPAEIANIIVFLASALSTPLHGAVLDASMGLGVHPGLMTGN
jgi:NAD(P)-dependent dehydrogenase (short-subunit alcohol dehydrogenase family)